MESKCPVCLDEIDNPIILKCGHPICKTCAISLDYTPTPVAVAGMAATAMPATTMAPPLRRSCQVPSSSIPTAPPQVFTHGQRVQMRNVDATRPDGGAWNWGDVTSMYPLKVNQEPRGMGYTWDEVRSEARSEAQVTYPPPPRCGNCQDCKHYRNRGMSCQH